MSKNGATFPQAGNDFHKSNGTVNLVMPGGPSMCRQEFAEECDINNILRRYETTGAGINGLMRSINQEPVYADFSEMPTTLMGYMEMMQQAETAFMTLPAHIRKEFDNSAMAFVEFAGNPENLDQMIEWELAPPKAAPAPAEVPPAAAPPSGAAPGGSAAVGAAPPPGASTHGST